MNKLFNWSTAQNYIQRLHAFLILDFDPLKQYNFFAGLFHNGRIIETAENSYIKTHPFQKQMALNANIPDKEFLHAEIAVLIKQKREADTITIIRLNKLKQLRPSYPCPICELAITKHTKIKYICYMNNHNQYALKEVIR